MGLGSPYLYCWWSLVLRVLAMKRSASFSRFLEYSISISDFFRKKSWRSCSSWTLMSVCWSRHFCCSTSWARISEETEQSHTWLESRSSVAAWLLPQGENPLHQSIQSIYYMYYKCSLTIEMVSEHLYVTLSRNLIYSFVIWDTISPPFSRHQAPFSKSCICCFFVFFIFSISLLILKILLSNSNLNQCIFNRVRVGVKVTVKVMVKVTATN